MKPTRHAPRRPLTGTRTLLAIGAVAAAATAIVIALPRSADRVPPAPLPPGAATHAAHAGEAGSAAPLPPIGSFDVARARTLLGTERPSAACEPAPPPGAEPVAIELHVRHGPELVDAELAIEVESAATPEAPAAGATRRLPCAPLRLALREGDRLAIRGELAQSLVHQVSRSDVARGAIELAIAPRRRLRGSVLAAEGSRAPLAATLRLRSAALPGREESHAVEGAFELSPALPPPWTIDATSPGYCPSRALDVDGAEAIEIAFARTATLEGIVLDSLGAPVADAVVLHGRLGTLPVDERELARSADDGTFRAGDVPAGSCVVSAWHEGHAPARVVRRADDPPGPVELRLAPRSVLRGRVVDRRGEPVAGATIVAGCLDDHFVVGSQRTDEFGAFDLPSIAPGRRYHVEVAARGFSPLDAGPFVAPDACVEIVLERLLPLRVRVVDAAGLPVARARVTALPFQAIPEHEWHGAALIAATALDTGDDGCATFPGLSPMRHVVFAAGPEGVAASATWDASAGELALRLPALRRCMATIRDPGGAALAGVELRLAARSPQGAWLPHPLAPPRFTDGAGVVELAAPAPGASRWIATVADRTPVAFELPEPCDAIAWAWPATARLVLELTGEWAARPSTLHAFLDAGGAGTFAADFPAGGVLDLGEVPAVPTRLRILDAWESSIWHAYAALELELDLRAGMARRVLLQAPPPIAVEGRIVGVEPALLDGAQVRFEALPATGSARCVASTIELDGRFVGLGVGPGAWLVTLVSTAGERALLASREVVVPHATRDLGAIGFSPRTTRIEAFDRASGRPLDDVVAIARDAEGRAIASFALGARGSLELALDAARACVFELRAPRRLPAAIGAPAPGRIVRVELEPAP